MGEKPRVDKKHLKAAEQLTRVGLSCAGETILWKNSYVQYPGN